MASDTNMPEGNQGKGKAPSTAEAARSRARRAPTNADQLAKVIDQVTESRMAQEAIRSETLGKFGHMLEKIEQMQKTLTDLTAWGMKMQEKQVSQDAEIAELRAKLESSQKASTETQATPTEGTPADLSQRDREQMEREAMVPQPVPRKWYKTMASKPKRRACYQSDEDTTPTEMNKPTESHPTSGFCGETGSTSRDPPPPAPETPLPTKPPSPKTPTVPPPEAADEKVQTQQASSGKPPQCPKCKFLHTGKCVLQPNTCFRCMQPGHQAKDCTREIVCNICKGAGHIARKCLRKGQKKRKN